MNRIQYESHRDQVDALREAFLREWTAEHKDIPESNNKAMKMLHDWQEFLKTKQQPALP